MPTLIRLIITLLFLAGLAYAGMVALIAFVEPTPREVTIRIPQRELLSGGQPALPGAQAPAAEASTGTGTEPADATADLVAPPAEPTTP